MSKLGLRSLSAIEHQRIDNHRDGGAYLKLWGGRGGYKRAPEALTSRESGDICKFMLCYVLNTDCHVYPEEIHAE